MKRIFSLFLVLGLVFCLASCVQEPDADVLTEEELDAILDEMILGDQVDLDDYSDEEKEQIKDKLDKDGFEIDDEGALVPKDPISDEKLDKIVSDALTDGEVDLDDYDKAQKEQIKDKLEEEGLMPDEENEGEGATPVVPIPELSDDEVAAILDGFGINATTTLTEGFKVEANLKPYPKNQQEQIIRAAGMYGLELKTEGEKTYFVSMTIHMDDVKDNPYE